MCVAPSRRPRCAPLLALAAVILLTWADVRSTVMQAAAAAPGAAAMCPEMAGMAQPPSAAPPRSVPAKSVPGKAPACAWCAAAAHAPLESVALRPTPAVHPVAFAAYATPRASGPRGPPARRPSARDPPRLSA